MTTKLICYLSFGFPTIDESIKMVDEYIESGCDMVEVDFPTDNAFLDSEFIGGRMKKSLEACSDYNEYFRGIAEIRRRHENLPIIALAYEHTVKKIGTEFFIENLKKNSIYDMILVGLEGEEVKEKLISEGIKVSCYVQYHLDEEEVASALNSNGFVYLQSKADGKVKEGYENLKDCIDYLRNKGINNPIYCGVGISTADDIKRVKDVGGDAVFVGSAILKRQENIEEMKSFIKELKNATK